MELKQAKGEKQAGKTGTEINQQITNPKSLPFNVAVPDNPLQERDVL